MQIRIPYTDISKYVSKHYVQDVSLRYVSANKMNVSTTINAVFLSKTVGINLSVKEVRPHDITLSYDGGWGTDLAVKGVLKFIALRMPAYSQVVEERGGNLIDVHLDGTSKIRQALGYFELNSICFDEEHVIIDAALL